MNDTVAGLSLCPGCKLQLPRLADQGHPYIGSSPECWAHYTWVLEREYSDQRYMAAHRMTVDTYCAQHPGQPGRRSMQSVNVHLVGLHLVLENGATGVFARTIIGAMTKKCTSELRWLDPPDSLGTLTVMYVLEAQSAEQHVKRVREWAEDVWAAWSPHHRTVAELAERAMERA